MLTYEAAKEIKDRKKKRRQKIKARRRLFFITIMILSLLIIARCDSIKSWYAAHISYDIYVVQSGDGPISIMEHLKEETGCELSALDRDSFLRYPLHPGDKIEVKVNNIFKTWSIQEIKQSPN